MLSDPIAALATAPGRAALAVIRLSGAGAFEVAARVITGFTALPARALRPPRIAECHSHFECKVDWTKQWLHRLMVCGRVEAVSIDADCITDRGAIVWDKVKPAHYCGARYRDRFVPAYDKPTRGVWRYDGRDDEFRPDQDWRGAFKSTD